MFRFPYLSQKLLIVSWFISGSKQEPDVVTKISPSLDHVLAFVFRASIKLFQEFLAFCFVILFYNPVVVFSMFLCPVHLPWVLMWSSSRSLIDFVQKYLIHRVGCIYHRITIMSTYLFFCVIMVVFKNCCLDLWFHRNLISFI